MSPLGKVVYPTIKLYKATSFNPSKYKWDVKKTKDGQHEMIEATVYNRKTKAKVGHIIGSKAIGENTFSLNINFFADNV
jgi:hypothetical protein